MAALRNTLHRMRLFSFTSCTKPSLAPSSAAFTSSATTMTDGAKQKSESEWRAILSPEQFRILRQKGTEHADTGEYNHHKEQGVYSCAGCGTPLYTSSTKFSSGCGWPAFFDGNWFALSPPGSVLIPRYSYPRGRQSARRQVSVHDPHRNHLYRLRWPSRTCIQGRRIPNTKYVSKLIATPFSLITIP